MAKIKSCPSSNELFKDYRDYKISEEIDNLTDMEVYGKLYTILNFSMSYYASQEKEDKQGRNYRNYRKALMESINAFLPNVKDKEQCLEDLIHMGSKKIGGGKEADKISFFEFSGININKN